MPSVSDIAHRCPRRRGRMDPRFHSPSAAVQVPSDYTSDELVRSRCPFWRLSPANPPGVHRPLDGRAGEAERQGEIHFWYAPGERGVPNPENLDPRVTWK